MLLFLQRLDNETFANTEWTHMSRQHWKQCQQFYQLVQGHVSWERGRQRLTPDLPHRGEAKRTRMHTLELVLSR